MLASYPYRPDMNSSAKADTLSSSFGRHPDLSPVDISSSFTREVLTTKAALIPVTTPPALAFATMAATDYLSLTRITAMTNVTPESD